MNMSSFFLTGVNAVRSITFEVIEFMDDIVLYGSMTFLDLWLGLIFVSVFLPIVISMFPSGTTAVASYEVNAYKDKKKDDDDD